MKIILNKNEIEILLVIFKRLDETMYDEELQEKYWDLRDKLEEIWKNKEVK